MNSPRKCVQLCPTGTSTLRSERPEQPGNERSQRTWRRTFNHSDRSLRVGRMFTPRFAFRLERTAQAAPLNYPRNPTGLPGTGKHYLPAWPRCGQGGLNRPAHQLHSPVTSPYRHSVAPLIVRALEGAAEHPGMTQISRGRSKTRTRGSYSAMLFSSGALAALQNAEPAYSRSTDGVLLEYRWSTVAVLVKA